MSRTGLRGTGKGPNIWGTKICWLRTFSAVFPTFSMVIYPWTGGAVLPAVTRASAFPAFERVPTASGLPARRVEYEEFSMTSLSSECRAVRLP